MSTPHWHSSRFDVHLHAALRHAPRGAGEPSEALRRIILHKAKEAVSPVRQPSRLAAAWRAFWRGPSLSPRLALATVAVLGLQTAVIGWLAWPRNDPATSAVRSTPAQQVPTLRLTFKPSVTEDQMRKALRSAGASLAGGPSELGEYWVWSSLRSLDEVRASLLASGLVQNVEVDLAGPREQ